MRDLLERLLAGRDMTALGAEELLETLAAGKVAEPLAGALLVALRAKGETPEEIRGFAAAMRRLARRPPIPSSTNGSVDLVGTGGDGSGSLNLSTGAALLTAACGIPVVKHGNRSISSRCGSADVLEALGYRLPADGAAAAACLESTGFTFLFAPHFHPAMATLAPVRRALGVRTVFNLLGPLTNPATPPYGVLGAYSADAAERMAHAVSALPMRRVFVVHGALGWDEATPCGPFLLFDVRPGSVRRTTRDPLAYGLRSCRAEDLAGGDAQHNARCLRSALEGETGPHRDALVLGAALALEVCGRAGSPTKAVTEVEEALDEGRGRALIDRLVAFRTTPDRERSAGGA